MAQLKKPTIKNPELVDAITTFKSAQNVENEAAMLDALKDASFIAPIMLKTDLSSVEADENGQKQAQASLMAVSNKNGVKMFPAFTDWLEFLKWKNDPDAETMVITFDQYCNILLHQNIDISGIVINPAELNIIIPKTKMAEMKGVDLNAQKAAAPASDSKIQPLFNTAKLDNQAVIDAANKLKETNSREAQMELFNVMRKATFVAPAKMKDMPTETKPGERVTAKAEFIMLNNGDKKFLPLFTNLDELKMWTAAPACQAIPMQFSNYLSMLNSAGNQAFGIVLNPFTLGLAFSKEQLQALQPQIQLTELTEIPFDMLKSLKDYMTTVPEIKKAYLAGVMANNQKGHMIILDTVDPKADIKPIADQIGQICKSYGPCMVSPAVAPQAQKAMEGKTPFYEAEA